MPRTPAPAPPSAHFVVDGSNIATEGRSAPSLQQLNEAVMAFLEEHPGALVTVVVDATFGHRIDKKEVKEFDAAVANNELVTPPAGAVGRGDAFVLSIAHKAKAGILSNDSFQEFHGKYDWLFDPGRLIGGKPVPHVGWVFVERTPVRGPKSRQSVKEAKQVDGGTSPAPSARRGRRGGTSSGSPLANAPLPVPTAPPPGPARNLLAAAAAVAAVPADAAPTVAQVAVAAAAAPANGAGKGTVNELVPFLDFVERHPVGTSCTAVVESYSSHGAYARSDAVLVYIPLRLMDSPPPRSARSRLKLGEAVTLVVVGYAPERRSVDAALPHMAPGVPAAAAGAPGAEPAAATPTPKRAGRSRKAAPAPVPAEAVADLVAAATDLPPVVDTPATDDAGTAPSAKPVRSVAGRRSRAPKPVAADASVEPAAEAAPTEPVAPAAPAKRPGRTRGPKPTEPAAAVETPAVEPVAPARTPRSRTAPAAGASPAGGAAAKPAGAATKASKATKATKASTASTASKTSTASKVTKASRASKASKASSPAEQAGADTAPASTATRPRAPRKKAGT